MTSDPFEDQPWVVRIHEVLEEDGGFWRSCSGCHELNEGVPTGDYSAAFKTHVGVGCLECGGLGVIWDDTDYADMGDYLSRENDLLSALVSLYGFVSSEYVTVPDEHYHRVTMAASAIAKAEGKA